MNSKHSEAGKGDKRRPSQVSEETLQKNWEAINWQKNKNPKRKTLKEVKL